jgi:hypothetical protein
MDNYLEHYLVEKYPKLFVNHYANSQTSSMKLGFCCGDGWIWLIDKLCDAIQSHIDNASEPVLQVVVNQVKQKFGELRFYYDGGDEVIRGMVEFAVHLSQSICEICGSTVNTAMITSAHGWLETLCGKCANSEPRPQPNKIYSSWNNNYYIYDEHNGGIAEGLGQKTKVKR